MMLRFLIITFFCCAVNKNLCAQRTSVQEYIDTYKVLAMEEMVRTGVPAAIKLAQGIIETEAGNSALVQKSNNHFGIKCKENWTGEKVSHDDDARGECFRKYPTPQDSYRDHSDFLRTRKHYHFLFDLDPTDYKAWAHGLKKAGYATNPQYPQMLIRYIEQYQLNDFSLQVAGKKATTLDTSMITRKPAASPATEAKKPDAALQTQQMQSMPASNAVKIVQTESTPSPAKQSKLYPEGVFRINDTKVMYAKEGTSLLALATQYNLPLQQLLDFNDMNEVDLLPYDQLIYLQRKRRTGSNDVHIVQQGESLHDIAQEEGIRIDALLEYNFLLATQQPAVGERLYLKAKAAAAPRMVGKSNSPSKSETKK